MTYCRHTSMYRTEKQQLRFNTGFCTPRGGYNGRVAYLKSPSSFSCSNSVWTMGPMSILLEMVPTTK